MASPYHRIIPSLASCYLPRITGNADTRSLQRPGVNPFLLILLIFYFRNIFCLVKFLRQRHLIHLFKEFRHLMDLSNIKINDFQILSAQPLRQGEKQNGQELLNLTAQWMHLRELLNLKMLPSSTLHNQNLVFFFFLKQSLEIQVKFLNLSMVGKTL